MRKLAVLLAVILLSSCTPYQADLYVKWAWFLSDKPENPPALIESPDDWVCGERKAAGCYYPDTHTMWVDLDSKYVEQLLNHEIAHAMIRGTPGHGNSYLEAYAHVKNVTGR